MIASVLRYPFTGGALVLLLGTLLGALQYGGILALLVTTSFALPVVRASAASGPGADRMPRLLPPPPGLAPALALGALLQLVYFAPFLLVMGVAFLVDDVPELAFLRSVTVLFLFLQLVLILAWPAAVALLASGEHPFTVLTRRVVGQAESMGARYGVVAAWLLLPGGALLCGAGELRELGLFGRLGASALVSWFWLVALHLVGRALRGRPPFARPESSESARSPIPDPVPTGPEGTGGGTSQ